MKINLTTTPELTQIPSKLFLYLEKMGPFMEQAPLAWKEFWEITTPFIPHLEIDQMAGLSRIDESKAGDEKFIYQAGIYLKSRPSALPAEIQLRESAPGKYAKFTLKGPYQQLGDAYPLAFEILAKNNFQLRDDYCIEIYVNTPMDTAEADLITEILLPVM